MDADLVQPLLNWCADQTSCGCDASSTEWCVAANTYTPAGQLGEAYVAVAVGDTLDFESMTPILDSHSRFVFCLANTVFQIVGLDSDGIYQKVSKDGAIISQRNDSEFQL